MCINHKLTKTLFYRLLTYRLGIDGYRNGSTNIFLTLNITDNSVYDQRAILGCISIQFQLIADHYHLPFLVSRYMSGHRLFSSVSLSLAAIGKLSG